MKYYSLIKHDSGLLDAEAVDKYNAEFAEAYAKVVKNLQAAAKDPDHPSNDRIKAYFAENQRKLAEIKTPKDK
jgi:hypothetical protein